MTVDLKREIPIACHGDPGEVFAPHLRGPWSWRDGHDNRAYGGIEPWRTCSYCGSMHPLDLLGLLQKSEAKLHGSDWKYGWPHKFYVDVRNPHAGKPSVSSSVGGGRGKTLEQMQAEHPDFENWTGSVETGWHADGKPTPAAATVRGKFYSEHLKDLSADEFTELASAVFVQTGIVFVMKEGRLMYRQDAA